MIRDLIDQTMRRSSARVFLRQHTCEDYATAVTLAMLNRHARRSYLYRSVIYDLKKTLIKHWYFTNLCQEVRADRQVNYCWSCVRGVREDGRECYRCTGGVYRTHRLFAFRFKFDDREFCWHQPERHVHDWLPKPVRERATMNMGAYRPIADLTQESLTETELEIGVAVLQEYLRRVGVQKIPGVITWQSVYWYYRSAIHNTLYHRYWRKVYRPTRWLRIWVGRPGPEDEIPF